MGQETPGFAALIEEAQRLPATPGSVPPEITSPFGGPLPPDHRVVEDLPGGSKIAGVVEYDYEAHVEVLCVNRKDERALYVEVLNDILSGKAMLRYEDRTVTKDGDAMITICWMTRKPRPAKTKLSFVGSDDTDD